MTPTLEVTYESAAGLWADWESQLQRGGLFAPVEAPELPPFAEVTLRLCIDGMPPIEVPARLTAASAGSLCIEVEPEARPPLARAVRLACGEREGSPARRSVRFLVADAASEPEPDGEDAAPDDASAAADASERAAPRRPPSAALSLDRKLMTMSVSEKVQLALHGSREERMMLLKDRAGPVQASLVRNPKSTLDEITALARSSTLAPEAAEALAQHPSYGASPQIALALARNPRTPMRTAVEMVDKLSTSDLRMLAKGLGVRMQIAQAARKKLIG